MSPLDPNLPVRIRQTSNAARSSAAIPNVRRRISSGKFARRGTPRPRSRRAKKSPDDATNAPLNKTKGRHLLGWKARVGRNCPTNEDPHGLNSWSTPPSSRMAPAVN